MRKSPFSTPRNNGENSHQHRGWNRGYANRGGNQNNHFNQFQGGYNQFNNQSEDRRFSGPYSPVYQGNARHWQQQPERQNRRYSNIDNYKDARGQFNNSSYSPYNRNHNYQKKNDEKGYRKLPMSEFLDLETVFENPWAELEYLLTADQTNAFQQKKVADNSVEIIMERRRVEESFSSQSTLEDNTINISSSFDEVRNGSSVNLELDSMNFSRDSLDTSVLSNSVVSDSDKTSNN